MAFERYMAFEPTVQWRDYIGWPFTTWESLDREASLLIGCPGVVIPSIRAGLSWVLETFGYARYRDHVLVPRFIGRCLLTAIARHALPVESFTPSTRLLLVVHQYGCDQRLETIHEVCRRRGWSYIEDSPHGLHAEEGTGPGSLGRFVSLSKVLPVSKGAFFITPDSRLTTVMRQRRASFHPVSWLLAWWLARERRHLMVSGYSRWGGAMSELYVESQGETGVTRVNIHRGLRRITRYSGCIQERLRLIVQELGDHVMLPDARRLVYAVPLAAPDDEPAFAECFRLHGFDATRYHVDSNRNVLDPAYRRMFLLPLNPTISQQVFEAFVRDVSPLVRKRPVEEPVLQP